MAIDTEERTNQPAATSPQNSAPNGTGGSNKKVIKIVLIVVGVLVVLGIVGSLLSAFMLKKGIEGMFSAVTGSNIKIDTGKNGGEVTIKGQDGEEIKVDSSGSSKLNKDFPKDDVPTYPGATIVSSASWGFDKGKTVTAVMESNDSADKVVEFYDNHFSSSDWKKGYSMDDDKTSLRSFTNDSKNLVATVSVKNDKGKTVVSASVVISEKKADE